jgi:hypothetical protein
VRAIFKIFHPLVELDFPVFPVQDILDLFFHLFLDRPLAL